MAIMEPLDYHAGKLLIEKIRDHERQEMVDHDFQFII